MSEQELLAEELADLTEGFHTIDLEALISTSWNAQIHIKKDKGIKKLVDHYKYGDQEDPWEELSPNKIRNAEKELSEIIKGQDKAVKAVSRMLVTANVGLSVSNNSSSNRQPKGVFFFVGPTGVGKTELAKAITKLVFGDENAFARFDMSEYREEQSDARLIGSPPGYVGYGKGGQLTNRVLERPYSILLFDEIEKAHHKILDKFLQILGDGRLTDGTGKTVYFDKTVIIFTSNIGASDFNSNHGIRPGIMQKIISLQEHELPSYSTIEEHFKKEVEWYFTSHIGRAELFGRLASNIVVFDILRPQYVREIGEKFMVKLSDSISDKFSLNMDLSSSSISQTLLEQMKKGDNLRLGGRRIETILKEILNIPLAEWIFQNKEQLSKLEDEPLIASIQERGEFKISSRDNSVLPDGINYIVKIDESSLSNNLTGFSKDASIDIFWEFSLDGLPQEIISIIQELTNLGKDVDIPKKN